MQIRSGRHWCWCGSEKIALALILIEDLGLQLPMPFKRSVTLGEQVLVKVSHVDPRQDMIQFQNWVIKKFSQLPPKNWVQKLSPLLGMSFTRVLKHLFRTPTRPSVPKLKICWTVPLLFSAILPFMSLKSFTTEPWFAPTSRCGRVASGL